MYKITPNWQQPSTVIALTTTNRCGYSKTPYASNNLALHVGDIAADVQANRVQLQQSLHLPCEPRWLNQTHSNQCVAVDKDSNQLADAAITQQKNCPLVVMTADCLPIVICNITGTEIAVIHAGWRGLLAGIIENTLLKMQSQPTKLLAWIGPAICQKCYEIKTDIYEAFHQRYPSTSSTFLHKNMRIFADLANIAALILQTCGVQQIWQSGLCTFENNHFYSYRRQSTTGRIATLIWLQ